LHGAKEMIKTLVTGAAGFIGYHLCKRLLKQGHAVRGLDNLNEYYDVNLKHDRLKQLEQDKNFTFFHLSLENRKEISELFSKEQFDIVVNLAAQPGVRYSLINPHAYVDSNICGFLNVLEGCRHTRVKHLVFASSSSVYGANTAIPFSVHHNVDHPVSLYAATKKANELMAHSYSHLFKLPCTGLRFFTVYGPWGRPDMAYFLFTKSILAGKPIDVFNHGNIQRDFTYIDDIIEGIIRVMDRIPKPDPSWSGNDPDPATSYAPYKLFNIGNNNPVELLKFIEILEIRLGKKTTKNLLPMQAGDVPVTYADVDDLMKEVGFKPQTAIEEGLKKFVEWYRVYYRI
jgi:UDP-glucuronate 4-epimerase